MIRITPIRLLDADNEQVGVVETSEALRMAEEAGLDLVEISPDARPPVCRIMDHGKFKYEQSKKDQANRSNSKQAEMKEIRLGRSIKIDKHDVQIRVDQSRRFLMAGHKVQITQRFRGREMAHKDLGLARLRDIADQLEDVAKVETAPRWAGRQASFILAPDKPKIEAIKAKLAREEAKNKPAESADAKRTKNKRAKAKPVGAAPTEAKPVVAASVETESIATTPVETKPVETKPVETPETVANQE